MWDPGQYGRYAGERARPFYDLVARVGVRDPRYIVDVGCGSGELTSLLAQRWPSAAVEGFDSSPDMLAEAIPEPRVTFTLADVREWRPSRPVDLIVSSAVLQWVDGHEQILRRLAGFLRPGGWLALQVPGNFQAPSHRLLREQTLRWVPDFPYRERPVLEPAGYVELLTDAGLRVDAWETTYLHVLQGKDPVLNWVKGTALRPVLAGLPEPAHPAFVAEYATALRAAYPAGPAGTLFPFRRIFSVGHSPA